MNKYLIMITVVLLAVIVACSSDETRRSVASDSDQQSTEIRLGSNLGEATRSNNHTNLLNGDTIYVWADMINGSTLAETMYFRAWALRANGVGGLTPLVTDNGKLFPATNSLNFYALCGNFGIETEGERVGLPVIDAENTELPTTGIRHTVLSNQASPEAYYKSDLLYAVVKNQEPISETVVLPFRHLLSRIQVVLVTGNGMSIADLSTATVKLVNLTRQITFSPDKDADFTSQTVLAGMLSSPMNAQVGDIRMSTNVVANVGDATAAGSTVYADAIVVPQTIAKGATFIQVDCQGQTTYYRIPNGDTDEPLVLESGKQYRFRLIADRLGEGHLFNTITVEDWGANSTTGLWLDSMSD